MAPSDDIDELLDPELDVGEVLVGERRQQRLYSRLVLALASIIIIIIIMIIIALRMIMILLPSSIHSASSRLTISRLAPSVQNLSSLAWSVELVTGHCNPSSSGWDGGG